MVLSFDLSVRGVVSVALASFVVNLLAAPLAQRYADVDTLSRDLDDAQQGVGHRQLQRECPTDPPDPDCEPPPVKEARTCKHWAGCTGTYDWAGSVAYCRSVGGEVCTDALW